MKRKNSFATLLRREQVCWYSGLLPKSLPRRCGRIEILMDEPLGTISPNIYGHFVENLSGVIYDGIWVGDNSKVPNIGYPQGTGR
jgi:alpha-N-arabinofuranosidase